MPPFPLPGERTCQRLLNDMYSSHRMELGGKEGRVQFCSLTWSDDQPTIMVVIKVKMVSFSVIGFL